MCDFKNSREGAKGWLSTSGMQMRRHSGPGSRSFLLFFFKCGSNWWAEFSTGD